LNHDPLSDADIETLADRLSTNQNAQAMSLEEVDGLFCALIASPEMISPSGYLPVVFGENSVHVPLFEDSTDFSETVSLLMRYWNSIVSDLTDDVVHLPYIEEPGTDNIPGRDWARGYLLGTRLAPSGWKHFFSDPHEVLALTIPVVAGEVDPEWPKEPLTKEKIDESLQSMCAAAARAWRYFEKDRQAFDPRDHSDRAPVEHYRPPFVRKEVKVGRNDPCPCGSGKKFKKCCGSSDIGPVY
jgi:uncharacterized protein